METNSPRRTSHRPNIFFRKTNAHPFSCNEHDLVLAGRQFDINQVVAGLNADGYDSAFECFGCDMADDEAVGAAAEPSVGDQCDAFPQTRADEGGGRF